MIQHEIGCESESCVCALRAIAQLAEIVERRDRLISELLGAAKALLDAPHQEHFETRLNDEEFAALVRLRRTIEKAERSARS